ncbi:MAG TPA: putative Fe-S cluster assembly protein SufT [Terriglobales bacterium]|jgi:probable FeS assembly SUF system protein SufT|nr:putative Fe-S cluster assembly protein SufT [Terriglobales bacterium]
MSSSLTNLSRTVEVIEIPSGVVSTLTEGTSVRIMQSRGDSYTVWTDYGQMYRIDGKDADAIGLEPAASSAEAQDTREFNEQMVWDILKTVYDPEIPVNIVDLGLIYSCKITPLEENARKVDIQMSMTAPGCGMGNVLKADVEARISRLPSVKEVHVEVVFDPPWDMSRMSEAARLQLGF